MALNGNITAIIELGERAFGHLYDIELEYPTFTAEGRLSGTSTFLRTKAVAETISYGGQLSLGNYYSEALKASFAEKISLVKQVTIGFRETADFTYFQLFTKWINAYFDSEKNCFFPGDPRGELKVNILNPTKNAGDGTQFIHTGVIPESVSFPQLSYQSSDPIVTTVVFTLERFSIGRTLSTTSNSNVRVITQGSEQ